MLRLRILRIRFQGWLGWRRLKLERVRDRIVRRALFKLWRFFGETAYKLGERLHEWDVRHAQACRELIEQTRRPPAVFCGECGQELPR